MPDAPAAILADGSTITPDAPVEIAADGAGASPDAPAAVVAEVSLATNGNYTISGTLVPDVTGPMLAISGTPSNAYPDTQAWSSDGLSNPSAGTWAKLLAYAMIVPATSALGEIAPESSHMATDSQSTASQIIFYHATTGVATIYWLYENSGDPIWVNAADGTMADQHATAIAAGTWMVPSPTPIASGLGKTWQDAAATTWVWVVFPFVSAIAGGSWKGIGTKPETVTSWTAATATGDLVINAASGLGSAPAAILADGSTITPDAPMPIAP